VPRLSGHVLFEEIEVWTARDVTFVLPDCYVPVTWEQGKLEAGNAGLAGLSLAAVSHGIGTLPTSAFVSGLNQRGESPRQGLV
jgi:hypothetical protein